MTKRCFECGQNRVEDTTVKESLTVGEYTFFAQLSARKCSNCGSTRFSAETLAAFELGVAVKLAQAGVNSGDSVKFMRKTIQLRAMDLAALLGVTPETVSRWETGKLPVEHRALALLGSLVLEKAEGRTAILDLLRSLNEPKPLNRDIEIQVEPSAT